MDADRTDEDLVGAVRQGDDRAFEALWQRYHRRIAAYVNGMVNDHARAEDITQDVFMSALRRMRDTDRPIAFKPWIYEIAKNACIDAFRRSRRAEEVSYDNEDGFGSADQVRLVSPTPTPDVAVDTRMSLDNLRGAFGGLSETHHDILVMRELEGLSYREIGERLGMSRPSVESTLFRARRRLTEEYEELISGERCRRMQQLMVDLDDAVLGARDARRMGRHVAHCQPCRRAAVAAGIDVNDVARRRPIRERIAALLPLPAFLRRRAGDEGGAAFSAGHAHGAQWAASVVGQYVEPATLSGWAKAAAAAATIAVAGVGAGVATEQRMLGFAGRDEGGTRHGGDDDSASRVASTRRNALSAPGLTLDLRPGGGAADVSDGASPAISDRDAGSAVGGDSSRGSGTTGATGSGSGGGSTVSTATASTLPRLGFDGSGSGSGSSTTQDSGSKEASGEDGGGSSVKLPVSGPSVDAPSVPSGSGSGSTSGGGGSSTPTGGEGGSTSVPTSGGTGQPAVDQTATTATGTASSGTETATATVKETAPRTTTSVQEAAPRTTSSVQEAVTVVVGG